jgi:hypothetical protein
MRTLIIGLSAILVGLAAGGAQADDAEARLELARETMALTGAEGLAEQMLDMMMPTMAPAIRQQYPDASDAQVAEALDRISSAMREASPELVDGGAQVYADMFTADELEAINAFYRTPAGARLVELMPELTRRSSLVGQRVATRVMITINPEIQAIMSAEADEAGAAEPAP